MFENGLKRLKTFQNGPRTARNCPKKSKISKGRLPPEDSSDLCETLGKRVLDDFAKMIFRGQTIFGTDFSKQSKKLAGRLPPEDCSVRLQTLGKRVLDDFKFFIFRR